MCRDDFVVGDINCAMADHQPLTLKTPPALPSAFKVIASEVDPVLADTQGRTLYRFVGSLAEFMREICDAACLAMQWRLVAADAN